MPIEGETTQGEMPSTPEVDTTGQPTLEQLQAELDQTRKALKEANREAAARRKALDALEAERQQKAEAEMSETEKLKAQIAKIQNEADQATAAATERIIRAEVVNQATAAGFIDPADAYALLDRSAVTFDESGEPANIKTLIEALAKSKPHLVKKFNPTLGATNPGGNLKSGETDMERKKRLGLSY